MTKFATTIAAVSLAGVLFGGCATARSDQPDTAAAVPNEADVETRDPPQLLHDYCHNVALAQYKRANASLQAISDARISNRDLAVLLGEHIWLAVKLNRTLAEASRVPELWYPAAKLAVRLQLGRDELQQERLPDPYNSWVAR